MATVDITPDALGQFDDLPRAIQRRMTNVVARLEAWPNVSGAKPMRGKLAGNFRVRTGDYRVLFRVEHHGEEFVIVVWRFGYRGDIYDREA
ncbi:MAG TPA: type II toxin-antitoxin system RelE/ParE family toxin [Tepidisphaeraceae bacterium]|nr:type II toxin-antitoxin system RelE/ParE family toxin [Tepidisphaeraceae bacterium]